MFQRPSKCTSGFGIGPSAGGDVGLRPTGRASLRGFGLAQRPDLGRVDYDGIITVERT